MIIGCDPAVNSGTETYRIISQNGTDFIVESKDNNLEDGDGDLRDGRYNFEKLDEVIWSIRKWPEVWETRKGTYLGNYINSSSIYALFAVSANLKHSYIIGDDAHLKRIYYFDKDYNIIEPQLGWIITLPKTEKKTGFT